MIYLNNPADKTVIRLKSNIMTRFATLIFFILLVGFSPSNSFAQVESDLYLFSLETTGKGEYNLHTPRFLNSFNKGGYTNQPSFTPEGDLLVSVRMPGESQTDIWQLSLITKKYKRLTHTKVSEYSPRIHPDEEHLTVLRQIEGEPMDQQVMNINLKSGKKEFVSGDFKDVGYYTWLSPHELGLFRIEGSINKLSYFNINDNKSRRITTSIGRSLSSDKTGFMIYVHKFTEEFWYIKRYDPTSSVIEIVAQTVGKNEDFVIAPDGTYFMGNGHVLFALNPALDKTWRQVADLSIYGIKYITRLAISPDAKKLVLVAEKEKA